MTLDAVIVGGGPAGLEAALILGRSTRHVLVLDDGRYRNDRARQVNGFLTRDGIAPDELRALGRFDLKRYGVSIVQTSVVRANAVDGGFCLTLGSGDVMPTRSLILATGVVDLLPAIPGVRELYGRSIFHCPYCDGWENRGRRLAVHGHGGAGLALTMRTWSRDVVLFSEGPVDSADAQRLHHVGIPIVEEPVSAFLGHDHLEHVATVNGRLVPRDAVFLKLAGQRQRSNLAQQLGLAVGADGGVHHDGRGGTAVPGLFVAGDMTRDLLLSVIAVAEGAEVGKSVNEYLQESDP